jgi:hypothetical protein
VHLLKKLMESTCLRHVVDHDAVLCLNTLNGRLVLRRPGGEVVAMEHRVARSGPASVGTTHLVSISVEDGLGHRAVMKVVVEGAPRGSGGCALQQ